MNAHPGEILTNLVSILRASSDLVNEVEGDESRIFAYYDSYPLESELEKAILQATHPSVIVFYMGVAFGQLERNEIIKHKFSIILRARETTAPTSGVLNMLYIIENATGTDGQKFRYTTIHEECYPIGKDLQTRRVLKYGDVNDIWELTLLLTEIGG